MKKCYLGIGILLFAILLQMTSTGVEIVALALGLVGLGFCLAGFIEKKQ
ncbi:MAG: hypothetical protein RR424_04505 [Oscillospiraceae bacterium]